MEEKIILNKIKSKYILKAIFLYIKDIKFKLKLFIHSKLFQNKLDMKIDYNALYIDKLGINFDQFFCFEDKVKNEIKFDKDIMRKKLEKFLFKSKLNISFLNQYIIYRGTNFITKYKPIKKIANNDYKNYVNNREASLKNKNFKIIIIDIYSPFFIFLSEQDFFSKIYIGIPMNIISQINLYYDYSCTFNYLNSLKINYSLFIKFKEFNELQNFQKINKNIKRIENLIIQNYGNYDCNSENYNLFFTTLFSNINIENNLIYLDIKMKCNLDPDSLLCINKFILLEYLSLDGFELKTTLELNLNNLQYLYLFNCINITFEKDSCLNIKKLILNNCLVKNQSSSLINFPSLKNGLLYYKEDKNYSSVINFKSIKNLKNLRVSTVDFINLDDNVSLENIKIIQTKDNPNDYQINEKMFEKLISINNLKNIELKLDILNEIGDEFNKFIIKKYNINKINILVNKCENYNVVENIKEFIRNTIIKKYIIVETSGYSTIEINDNIVISINFDK